MYKHLITESPNGYTVYVNLINSEAGHYISRQPYIINLIKEVVNDMSLKGTRLSIEHDMGRVIGNTDIVDTTDKDSIFYAQPVKKKVFSRYAKNRYPTPSNNISIIIQKDSEGDYEVVDTWIGPMSPPFPGDVQATAKSKPYWTTHALVQDAQLVQSRTITKDCPYE